MNTLYKNIMLKCWKGSGGKDRNSSEKLFQAHVFPSKVTNPLQGPSLVLGKAPLKESNVVCGYLWMCALVQDHEGQEMVASSSRYIFAEDSSR